MILTVSPIIYSPKLIRYWRCYSNYSSCYLSAITYWYYIYYIIKKLHSNYGGHYYKTKERNSRSEKIFFQAIALFDPLFIVIKIVVKRFT